MYEAVFGWAREHLEDLRLVRKTWHSMFFYSMNLFLNNFCIFAVENKTRHCMLEYEKDIIPTRILRYGQLSDGESLERGV